MSDYELIVSSAVRYALGRRTYIVGVVCSYVKSHLDELSEPCRRNIKRDIREAYSLGDKCDEREWKELERML